MGLLHTLLTTTILGRGTPAWTPANLFPTGTEEGLFLDFSDISTLYTSQTFATNISAIGDPVGGVLDKSQGLVLGAEKLTNGGFDTDLTGWTAAAGFSVSGGKLIGATVGDKIFQDAGITAGEVYSFTITGVVGEWGVRLGQDISNDYTITADGTYFITPGASYSTTDFRLRVNTAGSELASISVKKLSGNHLIQATSTARPIWTRHPKSGVRNLVDNSSSLGLTLGVGGSGATRTREEGIGPDGATIMLHHVVGNTAGTVYVYGSVVGNPFTATDPLAFSVYVKSASGAHDAYLRCGCLGGANATTFVNGPTTPINDTTWTRLTVDRTLDYSDRTNFQLVVASATTEDLYISNAQFEGASTATAYQSRVSQYDVTEAGVDDCYGLTFDGVDDYMVTAANLDLSGTDEVTLSVGAHIGDRGGAAYLFSHARTVDNLKTLELASPQYWAASSPNNLENRETFIVRNSGGSWTELRGPTVATYPGSAVITGLASKISNGPATLRVDGAIVATKTLGVTAESFGNSPAKIGTATTQYLKGNLSSFVLTDYILDAEQLAALETWTAARTPEVTLA